MKWQCKTLANSPIGDKQILFLHALSGSEKLRDNVLGMILSSESGYNFAVLYAEGGAGFPLDFDCPELSRVVLYIPIVTESYLQQCPKDFDWTSLRSERGIDTLPIVESSGLMPAFDARFNNVHALTLSMKSPAQEIEKQLKRMLIDASLNEEIIKDAFSRQLFISYRKKDKGEIQKIMKAVRGTEWAASAAFWFDDFLTPGTDFEEGIDTALKDADAVVMAVTPNLPSNNEDGQPNYVCSTEYPQARALEKKILAVEAVPTNRQKLDDAFDSFPECISFSNASEMNRAFSQLGDAEPEPDPYILYLRALAHLTGIRAEKDMQRAKIMLNRCMELGIPEAALQLSALVGSETGDREKIKEATLLKKKAFSLAEAKAGDSKYLEVMAKILFEEDVSIGLSMNDADEYYESFLHVLNKYKDRAEKSLEQNMLLWEIKANLCLGNVEGRGNFDIERRGGLDNFSGYLTVAKNQLDAYKNSWGENDTEYCAAVAVLYSLYASFYRTEAILDVHNSCDLDYKFASEYAERAVSAQERVVQSDESYAVRWKLATYKANALGNLYYKSNRADKSSYTSSDLQRMRQLANECIEEYEVLYAEKKNVQLAGELALAYRNRKILFTSNKFITRELKAARKRLKVVMRDYPDSSTLKSIDKDILNEMGNRIPQNEILHIITTVIHTIETIAVAWIAFTFLGLWGFLKVFGALVVGGFSFFRDREKFAWRILIDIVILPVAFYGLSLLLGLISAGNALRGILFLLLALASALI